MLRLDLNVFPTDTRSLCPSPLTHHLSDEALTSNLLTGPGVLTPIFDTSLSSVSSDAVC